MRGREAWCSDPSTAHGIGCLTRTWNHQPLLPLCVQNPLAHMIYGMFPSAPALTCPGVSCFLLILCHKLKGVFGHICSMTYCTDIGLLPAFPSLHLLNWKPRDLDHVVSKGFPPFLVLWSNLHVTHPVAAWTQDDPRASAGVRHSQFWSWLPGVVCGVRCHFTVHLPQQINNKQRVAVREQYWAGPHTADMAMDTPVTPAVWKRPQGRLLKPPRWGK